MSKINWMDDKTRIELEALICEREGCIAENKYREFCGMAPSYGEEVFNDIAFKMRVLVKRKPPLSGRNQENRMVKK